MKLTAVINKKNNSNINLKKTKTYNFELLEKNIFLFFSKMNKIINILKFFKH